METISLLWKEKPETRKQLHENVLDDMGISYLLNEIFPEKQQKYVKERMLEISMDVETIRYRQEIFRELFENPDFMERIAEALDKIKAYDASQRAHVTLDKKSGLLALIEKLEELRLYIEVILSLNYCLVGMPLHAEGFLRIRRLVAEISNDKGFGELRDDIHEITENMRLYQSVTLGLNLDNMLKVNEVVLLSVNQYRHKKNLPMLTRFGHFLQDAVVTNQNLGEGVLFTARNSDKKQDPLMKNLEHLLENDLQELTGKMWTMLQKYVDLSGCCLTGMIPELEFYLGFARFFRKLHMAGKPVCIPELSDTTENLDIRDCYNIKLFLKNQEAQEKQDIIYNDFVVDEKAGIFILTGPNSGGKTTYTQAVGCCVLLAQQGLAVPAQGYSGRVFDGIFTHFPTSEEETVHFGRLGEEARRISEIMAEATGKSLLLFNETYSSTSFSEGLYLAKDLVRALRYRRITAIYNTHMHELAADIGMLNEDPGEGRIDSLVTGMEEGKRSYKVLRRPPERSSYAQDIAWKYGVTYQQLIRGSDTIAM